MRFKKKDVIHASNSIEIRKAWGQHGNISKTVYVKTSYRIIYVILYLLIKV